LWAFTADTNDVLQVGSGTWDAMKFYIGDANIKMYITASGALPRIGIGTTDPDGTLAVSGAIQAGAGTSDTINISNWSATNTNYGLVGPSGYWGIRTDSLQGFNIDVYNDNNDINTFHISQDGTVGIGTTTPQANLHVSSSLSASSGLFSGKVGINTTSLGTYQLTVNGDIAIDEYLRHKDAPTNTYHRMTTTQHHFYSAGTNLMQLNNGDSVILGDSTSGDVDTRVYTTKGETLRIDGATGFISSSMFYASHSIGVGIGTLPKYPLHVYGSGSTVFSVEGSQGQLFQVRDSFVGTLFEVNDISGIPILYVEAEDTVTMGTYGKNTLKVTGSYVGIGTADPTHMSNTSSLHVWADVSASIFYGDGSGLINLAVTGSTSASYANFATSASYGHFATSASYGHFATSASYGHFATSASWAENAYWTASGGEIHRIGNVGISTTNPSNDLHIYNPNAAIRIDASSGDSGTGNAFLYFVNDNGDVCDISMARSGIVADQLRFQNASGGYVFNQGDVGINLQTTTRTPQAPLHVWGAVSASAISSSGGGYFGGNLGIGTTTPAVTGLHVWNDISASNFYGTFQGDVSSSKPSKPSDLVLTEVADYVTVEFSASSTPGVDQYEIWRAQASETASYSLIGLVKEDSVTPAMAFIDNSYTISGSLYYNIYALKGGQRSNAISESIALTASVADVTNFEIVQFPQHYFVQYEIPNDRRFSNVIITKDANTDSSSLDESSAVTIYSGRNGSYMYAIPDADLDKYHGFWVYTVTNT